MAHFKTLPQLTLGEALNEAKNKLVTFTGRSRRSEFWWCYLAAFIANIILTFIPFIGSLCSILLGLAMIPLQFRRLHDTGRSGWWWGAGCILSLIIGIILFAGAATALMSGDLGKAIASMGATIVICLLIPVAYWIAMLVFMCQDSQKEANKYGESPKYVRED